MSAVRKRPINLITHPLTHSLTNSLTHSLTNSLTHSLTHSLSTNKILTRKQDGTKPLPEPMLTYHQWGSVVFTLDQFQDIKAHYGDVIMGAIASQISGLTIVYSTVYSGADQRKHQSSVSLAFVRGVHRWPVNSPHKWPVTRKMFSFDDVIMIKWMWKCSFSNTTASSNGQSVNAYTAILEIIKTTSVEYGTKS